MVEGVVIERDQLSDLLKAAGINAKEIKKENERLRKERDALAAHVDRMTDVFRRLHLKSPSPIEVLQAYSYVMREAPAASLARRDACMKAEALKELAAQPGMEHFTASRAVEALAAEYREQAATEAMDAIDGEDGDFANVRGVVERMIAAGYRKQAEGEV